MSEIPRLETFLARLYSDADALDRFATDPAGEARRFGLPESMIAELATADITGLRMAAESYAWKRRSMHHRRRRRGRRKGCCAV